MYLVAFPAVILHWEHLHDSKVVPKMDLAAIKNGIVFAD